MADLSEEIPIKDAATAISQGKRHLLVRDYNLAVAVLAQACELLAQEHGETGDEMGELYLLYGRALLGLAREEAGVLGGGVPGSEEVSQDEQNEEEEEDEENEEGTTAESNSGTGNSPCTSNGKEDDKRELKENEDPKDTTKNEKDKKTEESVKVDSKIEEKTQKEEIPGCSRDPDIYNGEASGSGTKRVEDGDEDEENGEAGEEDVEKENEDDVNNLQIAWEVLELAKLVLLKRGSSGWKLLAEAYRLLGEVAMEGGNHESALIDFKACLNLLEKITPRDHRAIAEIHYQLGLTHAMANNFDTSVEQFNQASALLEAKIVHLKTVQDNPPQSDDPFYTVEGEIKELQELLPEIQEKIADIKDMKKEADVIKEIKEERLNGCSKDGEASEASGSGSTSKPASDISHLVRKKRKADDEEDIGSVCKKPLQEKDVA